MILFECRFWFGRPELGPGVLFLRNSQLETRFEDHTLRSKDLVSNNILLLPSCHVLTTASYMHYHMYYQCLNFIDHVELKGDRVDLSKVT